MAQNTAWPQLGVRQSPRSSITIRGQRTCPKMPPLRWQEPDYFPAGPCLFKATLLLSKVRIFFAGTDWWLMDTAPGGHRSPLCKRAKNMGLMGMTDWAERQIRPKFRLPTIVGTAITQKRNHYSWEGNSTQNATT